jgi:hypothetical protein
MDERSQLLKQSAVSIDPLTPTKLYYRRSATSLRWSGGWLDATVSRAR